MQRGNLLQHPWKSWIKHSKPEATDILRISQQLISLLTSIDPYNMQLISILLDSPFILPEETLENTTPYKGKLLA